MNVYVLVIELPVEHPGQEHGHDVSVHADHESAVAELDKMIAELEVDRDDLVFDLRLVPVLGLRRLER